MKIKVEITSKIRVMKISKSAKGWVYSFSVPVTSKTKGLDLTELLNCAIFVKERDEVIETHTGEFFFIGTLTVTPAYKNISRRISLFGFSIEVI